MCNLFQLSSEVQSLVCCVPYWWSCSSCTEWGRRTRDRTRWTSPRDRRQQTPTLRIQTANFMPEVNDFFFHNDKHTNFLKSTEWKHWGQVAQAYEMNLIVFPKRELDLTIETVFTANVIRDRTVVTKRRRRIPRLTETTTVHWVNAF